VKEGGVVGGGRAIAVDPTERKILSRRDTSPGKILRLSEWVTRNTHKIETRGEDHISVRGSSEC
jgi:hypothetical protein